MPMDIRSIDLRVLNSLTKYPSIPTYHPLGERGRLQPVEPLRLTGPVIGREKVDGTNGRIIFMQSGYLIGSREDLLFYQYDLIGNPAQGIVAALKGLADRMAAAMKVPENALVAVYLEVFGAKTSAAAKQYTGTGKVSFRLFDAFRIDNLADYLSKPAAEIAAWREAGGQPFMTDPQLRAFADEHDIPMCPVVWEGDGVELPMALEETRDWLRRVIPGTLCALDGGAMGNPEGVVIRTPDRSTIAKIRYEDYQRTLRKRA